MKGTFLFLGSDGHLHEHPDQVYAEKQFRRQLMNMAGLKRLPEECDHCYKSFNGYVWRCKECGEKLQK